MNNEQYEITIRQTWFKLLVDGVSKFYTKHEVLEKYIKLLEAEGFDTYYFDCNDWENLDSFSDDYRIKITKDKSMSDILPDKEWYYVKKKYKLNMNFLLPFLLLINQLTFLYKFTNYFSYLASY